MTAEVAPPATWKDGWFASDGSLACDGTLDISGDIKRIFEAHKASGDILRCGRNGSNPPVFVATSNSGVTAVLVTAAAASISAQ